MQNTFRFLLGLALVAPLFAQRDIGDIIVDVNSQVMGITVSSSSPELQNLALKAFGAHGRYRTVTSGGAFNLTFTPAGATAVTVTITKGSAGTPVHSETVAGTSLRNALLRAADVAVTKTSGLRGFFAGKLAFVGEATGKTEIYTSDLFFGEAQRWTSDGKQIMSPRWVPGGTKIVFTSYRTSFPDIYVLELDNRRISLLASFKGTNSGGRFSPDGQRVAMVLSGEGNPEIYVGNAQGRQIRRLTNNQAVEASPVWSPDGSRLIFTSDIIATGRPQLQVMSASGGPMTRLVTGFNYCAEPDWSMANPNKIAFTAAQGRGFQVAVYDLASGKGAIVSKAPADAIEPVWMADGRHVICTFRAANTRSLYLLDTESGKATRLSPTSLGNASGAAYLAP
ncbi:PD40 domain-containing protein [Opitutus sp. GAS368]|jgi:TolB protein|uniref:PD40 domain-containing protein n=1 Tax=Opitutus sp. GAS368 TaxID=1882749 RepID=UPI00087A242C|nr:PD40 domain-containing protein [Opitutus sp. GAS368]SDR66342.1 TolB protein [Opitutus sp. GAS368]